MHKTCILFNPEERWYSPDTWKTCILFNLKKDDILQILGMIFQKPFDGQKSISQSFGVVQTINSKNYLKVEEDIDNV